MQPLIRKHRQALTLSLFLMLLLCGFQGLLQWPFSKGMDIPPATFRPTSGGTWNVPLGRKFAVLEHTGYHLRENGAAMRRAASLRDFETIPLSGSYCITKKRILVRPGAGAPSSQRYTLQYSRVSRGTLHLTGAFLLLLMGGVHYAGRNPVAEATGGTVRRIGNADNSEVSLPRLVAIGESPVYGGAGYAAIKRIGASEVKGVGVLPLAIGFLGLAALLGSVCAAWFFEGRRWTSPNK